VDKSAPQLITGPARRDIIRWTITAIVAMLAAGLVNPFSNQHVTSTLLGNTKNFVLSFHGTVLMLPFVVSLAGAIGSIVRTQTTWDVRTHFADLVVWWLVVINTLLFLRVSIFGPPTFGGWFGYAPATSVTYSPTQFHLSAVDFWPATSMCTGFAAALWATSMAYTIARPDRTRFTRPNLRSTTSFVAVSLGLMAPMFLFAGGSFFWWKHFGRSPIFDSRVINATRWRGATAALDRSYVGILAMPALAVVAWVSNMNRSRRFRVESWFVGLAFASLGLMPLVAWINFITERSPRWLPSEAFVLSFAVVVVIATSATGLLRGNKQGKPSSWASTAVLVMYALHLLLNATIVNYADLRHIDDQITAGRDHLMYLGGPVLSVLAAVLEMWPRLTFRRLPRRTITVALLTYSTGVLLLVFARVLTSQRFRGTRNFTAIRSMSVWPIGTAAVVAGLVMFALGLVRSTHTDKELPAVV
jgi:Cytochrome C and Quinol oxidase polypeptide I